MSSILEGCVDIRKLKGHRNQSCMKGAGSKYYKKLVQECYSDKLTYYIMHGSF